MEISVCGQHEQMPMIHFDGNVDNVIINLCNANAVLKKDVGAQPTTLLSDLNHLSWEEIERIGRSGKARQTFALGATKTDVMKNGYIAVWQIIGFDHDDLADLSGKAPITWDLVHVYKDRRVMNDTYTNVGGFGQSKMKNWLNGEFLSLCSDELLAVVKSVIKLTSAGGESESIVKDTCKVFLKSEKEIFGRCFYSVPGEGRWYEYYQQEDVPYYKTDKSGKKVPQWERSPCRGSATYFCRVNSSGTATCSTAYSSYGVAPALCC